MKMFKKENKHRAPSTQAENFQGAAPASGGQPGPVPSATEGTLPVGGHGQELGGCGSR